MAKIIDEIQEKLKFATSLGNFIEAKHIIDKYDLDINSIFVDGEYLIYDIIRRNDLNIIKLLVKKGLNLEIMNDNHLRPIDYALKLKEYKILRFLRKFSNFREVQLFNAISERDEDMVEVIANSKINLELVNEEGFTPLLYAIKKGDEYIVGILLEAGANPNSNISIMPLFFAIAKQKENIVKILLEAGATPEMRDDMGRRALSFAVLTGNLKIVEILLNSGANPDAKNLSGLTALMMAKRLKLVKISNMLLSYGANSKNK